MLYYFDTQRTKVQTGAYSVDADTLRIKHGPYTVDTDTVRLRSGSINNIRQLSIDTKAQVFGDSYSLDAYQEPELDQFYGGFIQGWPFRFIVREKTYNTKTQQYVWVGDHEVAEMLERYITFETSLTSAAAIMQVVADQLGKTLVIATDDHSVRRFSEQSTVMQILSSLYGWTAALPSLVVSVYVRGDVLYCIQRGHETGSYSPVKYVVLSVEKRKIRTLMNESLWEPEIIGDPDGSYTDGAVVFNNTSLMFKDGYLMQQIDSAGTTTFVYTTDDPNDPDNDDKYLAQKTVVATGKDPVVTTYTYAEYRDQQYLSMEDEAVITDSKIYVEGALVAQRLADVTRRVTTYYCPMQDGFYSASTYKQSNSVSTVISGVPGALSYELEYLPGPIVFVGSQILEGRPGGKATPRERSGEENTPRVTISNNPIMPAHIPVTDVTTLERYRDAVEDNHGIVETRLTINCYDNHVPDYHEVVLIGGESWWVDGVRIEIGEAVVPTKTVKLVRIGA